MARERRAEAAEAPEAATPKAVARPASMAASVSLRCGQSQLVWAALASWQILQTDVLRGCSVCR